MDDTDKCESDKYVDALFDDQVDFLARLVNKKSTRGNEQAAQQQMFDAMTQDCRRVDRVPVALSKIKDLPGFSPVTIDYTGMENIVGHYGNTDGRGRSLIMNGHIDVTPEGPPKGWTLPPYGGQIREGKLYGRGASDMKAGLVGCLFALRSLKAAGFEPDARVFLQSVVEEESTGNGALACLAEGYTADAVLIGEPFNEILVTEQLGVLWFQVKLWGKPVHVEKATAGVNAIEAMVPVIAAFRQMEKQWNDEKVNHPAFAGHEHPINLNVGQIQGGDWTSSVPAWATVSFRIAVYPGDDMAERQRQVEATLAALVAADRVVAAVYPEIVYHGFLADGYAMPRGTEAEVLLTDMHQQVFDEPLEKGPITCTTDSRFYGLYKNIPSLVYGPRGSNFHGFDEYVELESLRRVTKVYARFIARWCGLTPIKG